MYFITTSGLVSIATHHSEQIPTYIVVENYFLPLHQGIYLSQMVLGEPCFWQELQESWCKNFRTRKHKVIPSGMSSIYTSFCIHMLQSESSICGGGDFPNHEYLLKPSCDIIIICFPDKTIFILLDCFMQLLQIQRLAKYYQI